MGLREALLVASALALLLPTAEAEDVWTGAGRIVIVGDLNGDFNQTVAVLRSAEIVDPDLNWSGGRTHLVQTGDAIGRGADPGQVLELLAKLENQARLAGGAVHALIGENEASSVRGELKDVSPEAFASFAKGGKPSRDDHGNPAGYAEYRRQFEPDGKYGKWIRRHNAIISINGILFAHGGLGPKYAALSLRDINDRIRRELADPKSPPPLMATDPEGPLLYSGLAQRSDQETSAHLDAVLARLQATRFVIGHTLADGAVTPRFGGKVILVNVGMGLSSGGPGRLACLVIENGQTYVLHRGRRFDLPADDPASLLEYFRAVSKLDPKPSPLLPRIEALEKQLGVAGQ